MPIYEYKCGKCNVSVERLQRMETPAPTCPLCEEGMKRLISRTSFALKGGGWFKDGYTTPSAES